MHTRHKKHNTRSDKAVYKEKNEKKKHNRGPVKYLGSKNELNK